MRLSEAKPFDVSKLDYLDDKTLYLWLEEKGEGGVLAISLQDAVEILKGFFENMPEEYTNVTLTVNCRKVVKEPDGKEESRHVTVYEY